METESGRQRPLEEVAHGGWDAIVIGAGPAGSVAALHLARAGRRALLTDRAAFPREKVCGDALIPDAIACLRRAGLWEEVRSAGYAPATATVFSPSRHELDVPGDYLTVKRRVLDNLLAGAASEAGAPFCRAAARSIRASSGGVTVRFEGDAREFQARAVILATGADVSLARGLGMVDSPGPTAFAMRCYVRSDLALDRLVVAYDRSTLPGYAWIFPMGNREFNVGCGVLARDGKPPVNLKAAYEGFMTSFPLARELSAKSQGSTPLKGAMLRCGLRGTRVLAEGPVVAVGETIGATFPYTGEGIGKAMETGEMAASMLSQALEVGDMRALEVLGEAIEERLRPRYLGYEVAERWFARPWLNDFLVKRGRTSPFVQRVLPEIFAERADPREVFSPWGLIKILVGR